MTLKSTLTGRTYILLSHTGHQNLLRPRTQPVDASARSDETPATGARYRAWGSFPGPLHGLRDPDSTPGSDLLDVGYATRRRLRDLTSGSVNAPRMTTHLRDEPIAKEPGQITSWDHWHASCKGIFGFTGIIAGIDNYSGHFRLFPVTTKAAAPQVPDVPQWVPLLSTALDRV